MKISTKIEKGFTLIELMIVVAIIGILAAIAIPQFASYRVKAFNAAAESDLHTARLAEEALFADYQKYGSSVASSGTAGAAGAGSKVTASSTVSKLYLATAANTSTTLQESPVTLSNKVIMAVDTDSTEAYATITDKHTNGDKLYAAETDQSGTYQKTAATTAAAFTAIGTATSGLDASGYSVM